MDWVDAVGIILGALLVVGSVLALLRFVLLHGDAKKDLDAISDAPRYVVANYEFFVKAALVHMFKAAVIFGGGLAIVLSSLPEVPVNLRLIISPVALLAILVLLVTVGELENGARQETKESFREERQREKE